MTWTALSLYYTAPIVNMNGRIAAKDFVNILVCHVYLTLEFFYSNFDALFKDHKGPLNIAHIVQNWFSEHENQLLQLSLESLRMNIIQILWSVLEKNV